MKHLRTLLSLAISLSFSVAMMAQSSLPAPGGVAGGGPGGGPGAASLPPPGGVAGGSPAYWGSSWGNPWCNMWGPAPASMWQNSGTASVLGCGYDSQGVWRVIPMKVAYSYNGLQYNVTVLNAWNPWSDMWNYGVDQPAYNTSYYLRGQNYSFYAPLSTGTYYFNL